MSEPCETCRTPEAPSKCDLCECALCKRCILKLPPGAFSMMSVIPPELSLSRYCRFCFDDKVQAPLTVYEETLELAKDVFIFFETQRKEIPLIRKSREVMKVADCDDRDETILRLAYMAAEQKYNAVVDTYVDGEKKRNHAHQTYRWSGRGTPALIDAAKMDRQDRQNQIYR